MPSRISVTGSPMPRCLQTSAISLIFIWNSSSMSRSLLTSPACSSSSRPVSCVDVPRSSEPLCASVCVPLSLPSAPPKAGMPSAIKPEGLPPLPPVSPSSISSSTPTPRPAAHAKGWTKSSGPPVSATTPPRPSSVGSRSRISAACSRTSAPSLCSSSSSSLAASSSCRKALQLSDNSSSRALEAFWSSRSWASSEPALASASASWARSSWSWRFASFACSPALEASSSASFARSSASRVRDSESARSSRSAAGSCPPALLPRAPFR
mmetsp:Transcript_70/g.197  ORF Transcript_70/g.197 Transcript_70/m.197 type:complete len:267 (-) Transcript_70:130-930(-)